MKISKCRYGYLLLGLCPGWLFSLPSSFDVKEGSAVATRHGENELVIRTSEKAILRYEHFSVSENETVRFEQPSRSSAVLNRITGGSPSFINGRIESNGKVLFINPDGIVFGSKSCVNVGSLVASTYEIADHDFLEGRYLFSRKEGKGSIEISGNIRTSESAVFLTDRFLNDGSVIAETGSIVVAGGEKITLDFTGGGLVSFAVEGESKGLVLRQEGMMQALSGEIRLASGAMAAVWEALINTEGLVAADEIFESDGMIYLGNRSAIEAKTVAITGSQQSRIEGQGKIQAAGGGVTIEAGGIDLQNGEVNVSDPVLAGNILIGKTAKTVVIGDGYILRADGSGSGSGGRITVFSSLQTVCNGILSARGGDLGGDGGFIETSGGVGLSMQTANVDTGSPFGVPGTWLLDPRKIVIGEGGDLPALSALSDSGNRTSVYKISPFVIENGEGTVVLAASEEIRIDAPLRMQKEGAGIVFSVEKNTGTIVLGDDLSFLGGSIRLEGKTVIEEGKTIHIDTGRESSHRFGSVIFTDSLDGPGALSIAAGSEGTISFQDAVGASVALGGLDLVTGGRVFLAEDIVTDGGKVSLQVPVVLKGNVKIDTTGKGSFSEGADIIVGASVNGNHKLILDGGETGKISIDPAANFGSRTALSSILLKAGDISLNGNMSASGGTIIFNGPLTIGTDVTLIDTGPTGIIFLGAVTCSGGAHSMTAEAPVGRIAFLSSVGSSGTLPSDITATSNLIQIGADISVSNQLTTNGSVVLLADTTLTASTLLFSGTIDGAYDLTLDVGPSGTITLGGQTGAAIPLNTLTIASAGSITAQGIYADAIIQTGATSSQFSGFLHTTGPSGIDLTGGSFVFQGGITTENGGGFVLDNTSAVTTGTALSVSVSGAFSQTGSGPVSWQGTIKTENRNIGFASDLLLTGPLSLNTGSAGTGNITFAGTVNGNHPLTMTLGSGDLLLSGAVGGITPLGDIVIYSAEDVTAGNVSALSLTQLGGYGKGNYLGNITTTGAIGISLTSTYLNFTGTGKLLTANNGNILINSVYSGINTTLNPVIISVNNGVNGTLFVGSANTGYFSCPSLTTKFLANVRSNPPCSIVYNGVTFLPANCPVPTQ